MDLGIKLPEHVGSPISIMKTRPHAQTPITSPKKDETPESLESLLPLIKATKPIRRQPTRKPVQSPRALISSSVGRRSFGRKMDCCHSLKLNGDCAITRLKTAGE